MGTAAWFMEYNYYTNPASRSGIPEAMQPIYDTQPMWLYVVFAVAVLTGLVGCIGLLLRKSWCDPVFLISLIAVIILHGFNFFVAEFDYIKELEPQRPLCQYWSYYLLYSSCIMLRRIRHWGY